MSPAPTSPTPKNPAPTSPAPNDSDPPIPIDGAAIDAANSEALGRLTAARPVLRTVATARDVIPALAGEPLLLHAGPPIEWQRMSGPLRGAIVGAALFEGWARDPGSAEELASGGGIRFEPCHHHGAVGPMAGVTSPSMAVYVVENGEHGNRAFSNLNEGYGKVLRYGAFDAEVLDRLRFMNEVMAPLLADALEHTGGLDLRTLLAEALHMGDEGHNRNKAGSLLMLKAMAPALVRAGESRGEVAKASEVIAFLGDTALSVLNPVMAACKAMADSAHGVAGSTLVTTMARNGTDFGIRVSGLGGVWFTAPAATPDGLYFPGFSAADANPDIGDSTITETAGIGAFAMAAAPAIVSFVSGTPRDALDATLEMYEITAGEHPHFTIPPLDFRGT
ncbi:MAG: DUF1116 domain-containing protein, partial [Holophagales bacterium]|nr:DUF1116 domain-containing protein [Holophagales bacterium]